VWGTVGHVMAALFTVAVLRAAARVWKFGDIWMSGHALQDLSPRPKGQQRWRPWVINSVALNGALLT
jgi:hypothetical protein